MTFLQETVLIAVFFIASMIGVVTGSNSLVTVPLMFQFGIDPKTAVATNMFGLTFLSIGASIPFLRNRSVDLRRLMPMIVLTVMSSLMGALIAAWITSEMLKLVVSAAMLVVAVFIAIKSDIGLSRSLITARAAIVVYVLTFLLGIYGGLYSGGYVTMLTSVLVAFSGMTFAEAVASTKVINVFSSLVASLVFMQKGLVDYRLGLVLGLTMFVGAYIGAHYAARLDNVWLRRIFIAAVILLAIKTLFDFF